LPSLARLIVRASRHSQIWVVSHAQRLIAALEEAPDCNSIHLQKEFGQSRIAGQRPLDEPAWHWPER
jgi:predicted ATPase